MSAKMNKIYQKLDKKRVFVDILFTPSQLIHEPSYHYIIKAIRHQLLYLISCPCNIELTRNRAFKRMHNVRIGHSYVFIIQVPDG